MHHVIWIEHDGSWTWSIEEGKAFEDDHKVLARDDGFPTRGDAKEDMQKAWAKLIDEGKRPGKLSDLTKSKAKPTAKKKATGSSSKNSAPENLQVFMSIPEWGVFVNGKLEALFSKKTDATRFGKEQHAGSHTVEKIKVGVST